MGNVFKRRNRVHVKERGILDESIAEQQHTTSGGERIDLIRETAGKDIAKMNEPKTSTTHQRQRTSRSGETSPARQDSPGLRTDSPGFRDFSLSIDRATSQCKVLLNQISNGGVPEEKLKESLTYIMDVLQSVPTPRRSMSSLGSNRLEQMDDEEVRDWLTSTFTHSESKPSGNRPSFKAVAGLVMAGQHFGKKIHDTPISYPDGVDDFFKTQRDQWCCDIFQLDNLTNRQPLKYMGHELFRYYGFLEQYEIPNATLNRFLETVEQGYTRHNNPYHNSIHAADVTQTLHCFIKITNLQNWLSSVEILSMIFAAMIHDLEHTGTSNAFHVKTRSEIALCYNDTSVLENYHLFKAFSILTKDTHNILKNLPKEDFELLRSLVIEMVMATDMSKHFLHVKHLKKLAGSQDAWSQIQNDEKPKVLSLFLHMADISHPGKNATLHENWSHRLIDEFFRQGDQEKELKIPCSPLCDRNTTAIPESQLGFIDWIVEPAYGVCGNIMELIVKQLDDVDQVTSKEQQTSTNGDQVTSKVQHTGASNKEDCSRVRPWEKYIKENKENWRMKSQQKSTTAKDDGDDSKEESAKDTK